MKSSLKSILLGIMLVLASFMVFSCDKVVQLKNPTDLVLTDNVLTWTVVEHASSYTVDMDGKQTDVTSASYTILANQPGSYQLKVRANGKGNYKNSEWSNSIIYVVNTPEPINYKINETFNEPNQQDEWNLGSVNNMHQVKDGKLTLTNTGLVPYPSRGKHMKVTISKYPYLVIKVDDLGGNNPRWAIKIQLPGDSTPSRSVTSGDMTSTGLFFYDLRRVEGLEDVDEVEFDFYIYIIESEGNFIAIDFIQSLTNIPGTKNFDNLNGISVTGGTMEASYGILHVNSNQGVPASVKMSMFIDTTIANMLDLFVAEIDSSTTFTLKVNNTTVIENGSRFGHYGIDLTEKGISLTGNADIEFIVIGEIKLDRLANTAYAIYHQSFESYTNESIYNAVKLSGSADVSIHESKELLIHKISALKGDAKVRFSGTTNYSTYPKFSLKVTAIDEGATLNVLLNNRKVLSITSAGSYEVDMTAIYQTGHRKVDVDFVLVSESDAIAQIHSFEFVKDDEYSKNALAEKGDKAERIGTILEEGYQSDNWGGTATIFSRNGQLWIVNSDYFSKGEVFGRNIDLSNQRYLNIKVDELTQGATWKIDVMYNVGLDTEFTVTVQQQTNQTGIFSYDLYKILNLNDNNKTTARLSFNFFIIGGNDKIAKIDYVNLNQTPTAENEIINIKPYDDMYVTVGAKVDVNASLRYPVGQVDIKVSDELGKDVTSTVFKNGIFTTQKEGIYTITYSYDQVEVVERVITVTSQPVVVTQNTSTTLKYNETLLLSATVLPDDGSKMTYRAYIGQEEVTEHVLSAHKDGSLFTPKQTGTYRIIMKTATSNTVEIQVEVITGWIAEASGNNQNKYIDGKLVFAYEGNYYWPKHESIVTVSKEKPFMVVDTESIVGGTWKMDIDLIMNNAIPESGQTGVKVIDLRQALGTDAKKNMKFVILIVGSNVKLTANAIELLSYEEMAAKYNLIQQVLPTNNQSIYVNTEVKVSAQLKYPMIGQSVTVRVLNSSDEEVTSAYLNGENLTITKPGIYRVIYESPFAKSVERVLTVLTDSVPSLSTTNELEHDININESYPLLVEVENPKPGEKVTYTVTKVGSTVVITGLISETGVFLAKETGVYTIKASYPGAEDLILSVTVKSGWIHENNVNGNLTSEYVNGEFTLHYDGNFYWPTVQYKVNVTTDLTPFVAFEVKKITGGTWKMELGDAYRTTIITEGTKTGLILINLKDYVANAGYGETHRELTMTFTVYIVGSNVSLTLTPVAKLTYEEVAQNHNGIINVKPTNQTSVLPNTEVNVSASLKYPLAGQDVEITIKNSMDEDITASVLTNHTFKTDIPGIYTVIYHSSLAKTVTTSIEVVSVETPVITTTNHLAETLIIGEEYLLNLSIENPSANGLISILVYKDGVEVDLSTNTVNLSQMSFKTMTTGNYQVIALYPEAQPLIQTITVKTPWVAESINNGGKISSSSLDGQISLNYEGSFYWPTFKYQHKVTTDQTPYLAITIDSITGGTWKMELGDPYRTTIIDQGTTTGLILINLRDHVASAGYGETNRELTMTLTVYVIGSNVTFNITGLAFLTQQQVDELS